MPLPIGTRIRCLARGDISPIYGVLGTIVEVHPNFPNGRPREPGETGYKVHLDGWTEAIHYLTEDQLRVASVIDELARLARG